ncbi:MAG: bifunctional hydroxymethylpyrimidine kinase/phosphomethylpyrimidine kinase [Bacillota bacterium]
MTKKVHTALTVAGSDSGGGAGIQADLKTFMAHGVYGASAITAITAQNTTGVSGVHMIPPEMVAAQIDAVVSDIGADAAKTGMLGTSGIVEAVADRFRANRIRNLVIDPVMVATSGDRLSGEDTVEAYIKKIFPLALLVTPNLLEAEVFYGRHIDSVEKLRDAALHILEHGPRWVLIKGGHRKFARDSNEIVDLLTDGKHFEEISNPRVETHCTHGTGCTLSAAIAAGLARGMDLPQAVKAAEKYLHDALTSAIPVGKGHGPVNHSVYLYPMYR